MALEYNPELPIIPPTEISGEQASNGSLPPRRGQVIKHSLTDHLPTVRHLLPNGKTVVVDSRTGNILRVEKPDK